MTGHSTERISLGTFPTPLEPAPRLAAAVGLRADRLWIKRDDLTGLGGGGNKVRKLERTLAAALRDGADCLVTTGAAQSNHARLTAAAGARLGLPVTLVLAGDPRNPAAALAGNLLLDEIFGARIRWAGDADDIRLAAVADETAAELASSGARPAVIPFGGSNRDGALAYADAARELRDQLADQLADQPGDRGGLLSAGRPRSSPSARAAPWPGWSPSSDPSTCSACTPVPSPPRARPSPPSPPRSRPSRSTRRPCACAPTRWVPATAA